MFEFPSYCSIYSSHGDINFDKPNFDGEACFKKIFDPLEKMARDEIVKNHYKIYLCKDIEFIEDKSQNNFCFFSEEEIRFHISYLRFIAPFQWKLSTFETNYDFWKIELKLQAAPLVHRMFLTWIRYLYESPFTLAVYDALQLRKIKNVIKTSNYMNLLNLTLANYSNDSLHQISRSYADFDCSYIMEPLSRKQFKERLLKRSCLNSIYNQTDNEIRIFDYREWDFDKFKDQTKERLNIYIEQLKRIER